MTAGIRKVFAESPKEFDPRKYLGPARATVKEVLTRQLTRGRDWVIGGPGAFVIAADKKTGFR